MLGASALLAVFLPASAQSVRNNEERIQPISLLYRTHAGLTLNYVEQGDAAGPVLVFLHGGGDSWHSWDRVLPLLPHSYHVYAITLRGHGLSDHPEKGYAAENFAQDILDFLGDKKIEQATLIGHSLGSFTAQKIVELDGRRIARLVLIGSGPSLNQTSGDHNGPLEDVLKNGTPAPYAFARDFQASTIYAPVPAENFERWVAEALLVSPATMRGIATDFHTSQKDLAQIQVPTLIFWGEKDLLFNRVDEDALLHGLPHARLIAYPETGHALHWEKPVQFTADLLHFIEEK